jgi:hypothetical protein
MAMNTELVYAKSQMVHTPRIQSMAGILAAFRLVHHACLHQSKSRLERLQTKNQSVPTSVLTPSTTSIAHL